MPSLSPNQDFFSNSINGMTNEKRKTVLKKIGKTKSGNFPVYLAQGLENPQSGGKVYVAFDGNKYHHIFINSVIMD